MKFVIKGTLPGLNEIIDLSKRSKHEYAKMKDRETLRVTWSAIKQLGRIKLEKSNYTIHWICPNMRRDKDNIIAGQKFIFDGLQEAGFIVNDGWKQIGDISHKFGVDKLNPRVEVEIS